MLQMILFAVSMFFVAGAMVKGLVGMHQDGVLFKGSCKGFSIGMLLGSMFTDLLAIMAVAGVVLTVLA